MICFLGVTITETAIADRYLELMKGCLARTLHPERYVPVRPDSMMQRLLSRVGLALVRTASTSARQCGGDWPSEAETMIGTARLNNLHACVRDVITRRVPGDLIETGVWRGGACILMRAALEAYGDDSRRVWVADSFAGLPPPDLRRYPQDEGDEHHKASQWLAVSLEQVRENFARYGLLDERVRFLPGWFHQTLPSAPIDRLSIIRLDGDMYGSTWEAITALYPKLSAGGYCIVDDYGAVKGCREAIHDYRSQHGIADPIQQIDWTGVFWQRA